VSRVPKVGGRFNGTLRMSSVLHTPSRLGCPHDVRGGLQFLSTTAAAVVSAGTERSADGSFDGPPRCASARDPIDIAMAIASALTVSFAAVRMFVLLKKAMASERKE
jgi:hypothetical protein